MDTQIVLVRHGETEWNRVERFRGRADLELNEKGIRQAKAAAKSLFTWKIDAVYSSPLKRAFTTASIIAEPHGLQTQPLEGIIDINYGDWQGLTPEEAATSYPDTYRTWLEAPHLAQIPNGETLSQVRDRAFAALEEVIKNHAGQTIVLVSHKVVCKILLCALIGLDNSHFWQIEQDTCAINLIEQSQGGFFIKLINDTCHLHDLI